MEELKTHDKIKILKILKENVSFRKKLGFRLLISTFGLVYWFVNAPICYFPSTSRAVITVSVGGQPGYDSLIQQCLKLCFRGD